MGCTIQCQEQQFGPIEAVLFDKDGTLANSEPYLYQLGRSRARFLDAQIPGVQDPLLMAFGFDEDNQLNPQGLLAVSSRRDTEIAAAAYVAETGRGWVESLKIVNTAFKEADENMPPKAQATGLVEGVDELVRSLHHANIRLGIISSDITQNVVKFAHQYDLTAYFEHLLGMDTVDKSNPNACTDFFLNRGINPARILVIGDSAADIQLAQGMGAASIGVIWGWNVAYSIKGAGAIATQPTDIQIVTK
ncbi:MAG: HAD family hydrolase [Cyanobacteria bacterium P01_F01_bin.150]